jgi:hypothetical protein
MVQTPFENLISIACGYLSYPLVIELNLWVKDFTQSDSNEVPQTI